MNRFLLALTLLGCLMAKGANAQEAPQIRCEIGTTAWCIATFDGSISMQDVGESRIWKLQARTADSDSPMKIIEAKACSDVADEQLRIVQSGESVDRLPPIKQMIEFELNTNGCRLIFEIPQGKDSATYQQVMLYGILVGSQKKTQLYKVK